MTIGGVGGLILGALAAEVSGAFGIYPLIQGVALAAGYLAGRPGDLRVTKIRVIP